MEMIEWGDDALQLLIQIDDDGRTRLVGLLPDGSVTPFERALPLVEVVTTTRSRRSGSRYDRTDAGMDLRHVSHRETMDGDRAVLEVELQDPASSLRVTQRYARRPGFGALSSSATVVNDGGKGSLTLLFVSSFALGDRRWDAEVTSLHLADNEWLAEARWRHGTFAELGGPDVAMAAHGGASPRGALVRVGRGTWSTGEYLPMGAFVGGGSALVWQVESNGGWRWQVARSLGDGPSGTLDLVTSGPTDPEHQWSAVLAPGESFTTPLTTVASAPGGFEDALAVLTRQRRLEHRVFAGDAGLPIIYNDYMNTLNADPTTEKLLPLIEAVGTTGAEVFVVDAGWYSDEPGWWDTVGAWTASKTRFPGGFGEVFDAIRAQGLRPGLWLEPEVIGVRSPAADELPDEAFFCRGGERLVVDGRFRLDFRHPAVVTRLDRVLDRLIGEYGLAYLKFDDNTNPLWGTDVGGSSPGDGTLRSARAFLDWIDRLHERHPGVILENCASGGMRADGATMSHFALLSTSDQQDALRCVPIAASAPTMVPPEFAGVWSYPQAGMPLGETVVTLANSVLRRPILSGRLDRLAVSELQTVREFVAAHRSVRVELPRLFPTWPLGLPGWDDDWVATGLVGRDDGSGSEGPHAYLTVWRRGGVSEQAVPLAAFGPVGTVTQLFPAAPLVDWTRDEATLRIRLTTPSAVVLRLARP